MAGKKLSAPRKQKALRLPIDRVLDRVERIPEVGCWIFMGSVNESGYGIVGLGARGEGVDRAHRITYRHFVGDTPEGMVVCHRCDTPACCNPHHLFLGTHADNHADMRSKKRDSKPPRNAHDRGEYRYNSILKDADVAAIRAAYDEGARPADLARKYGYSQGAMVKVCKRQIWKHLP